LLGYLEREQRKRSEEYVMGVRINRVRVITKFLLFIQVLENLLQVVVLLFFPGFKKLYFVL
jgi:hypothetical protein